MCWKKLSAAKPSLTRTALVAGLFVCQSLALAKSQDPAPEQDPVQPAEPPIEQPKPQRNPSWLEQQLRKVRVTGSRFLTYQIMSVSGDREAFEFSNFGGLGGQRFSDLGYTRFEGRGVFGVLNFSFNLQDSRFQDPQGERISLDWKTGPWTFNLGDIQGSLLNTNRYASFNRTLRGASVGYRHGRLEGKALRSETRGEARTITLNGNNSAGPYYLQSSQIIRGSERIAIDGVLQVFGEDYSIDYDLGAITFVNRQTLTAKVVAPTSTIVATYESFNFNGSSGTVEGIGLAYDMGRAGRIGVTGMRQLQGGQGRDSSRLEKFQGFGPPSSRYTLQFLPQPGTPIVIRIDGVLQTEGIDYRFDPANPSVFFINRFVLSTSTVDVLYTPRIATATPGDRETFGLDYRLNLGSQTQITASTARGSSTGQEARSGTATAFGASTKVGPWSFSSQVRNVTDGFVTVQTVGLDRNEKAWDVTFGYSPSEALRYSLSHSNSAIANRTGTTSQSGRFVRTGATLDVTPQLEKNWPLQLALTRTSSQTPGRQTSVDALSLTTAKQVGKWGTRFGLETSRVSGATKADLQSLIFRNLYQASSAWFFGFDASLSQVRAAGKSGTGYDVTGTIIYRGGEKFNARFTATESDSGDVTDLQNFDNGFGFGFNGNGFSSGAELGLTTGVTSGRFYTLTGDWQVTDRLFVNGAVSLRRSTGSISSNSDTRGLSGGLDYRVNDALALQGQLNFSETQFVGSPLRSSATTLNFGADGRPAGRLSYRLNLSALLSGGNSQFRQNSIAYDISTSYFLGQRQNLVFRYSKGTTTGYYPQDDLDWALTHQIQIFSSLSFNTSYRFRDVKNRDLSFNSGAYRSRGFAFELAFNFAQ
ncbi:MAG: hypothetical protein MUC92_03435 [Fimbriimonadaceae bacterium]|jgi:hypothetical protein|nr:hypothetical protein [Fimbriimonadaceae bacterium]